MAYTTLADLKVYLGIGSARDDAILTACLAAAIAKVDEQFSGKWESTAGTRYYSEDDLDFDTLWLDAPLLTVTTLTGGDGDEILAANYWLMPRNANGTTRAYDSIKLKSGYTWDWNTDGEISVLGTWGFTATAPSNVIQAVWRLASFYYRIKDNQTFGTVGNVDLGITEIPATIPKDVEELLDGLRHNYDLSGWGN